MVPWIHDVVVRALFYFGKESWLLFFLRVAWSSVLPGNLGQVWYLIVSIPDLCTLTYFVFYEL